jgi:hypothetical protein
MKNHLEKPLLIIALILAFNFGLASTIRAQVSGQAPTTSQAQSQTQASPDIEKQRQDAEAQASKTLDQDAITAIAETQNAAKAIADGKIDEARAAIEQATGKINGLVTCDPATALVPVEVQAEVIDTALADIDTIKLRAQAAKLAVEDKDYPAARVLLDGLISEIRVRVHALPLATYPAALKDSARLLDEKKDTEARQTLQLALNTLVIIDKVNPLPLVLAQKAINDAQAIRESDKDGAAKLLAIAKYQTERAKELGYAGNDKEYASLNTAISELEKQLKGNQNTTSAFTQLIDKVTAFFQRQSSSEKKSEPKSS